MSGKVGSKGRSRWLIRMDSKMDLAVPIFQPISVKLSERSIESVLSSDTKMHENAIFMLIILKENP